MRPRYRDASEHCALPAPSSSFPKGWLLPDRGRGSQIPAERCRENPWLQAACWVSGAFTSFSCYRTERGERCSSCLPPGKLAEVNYLNTPSSHISAHLERVSSCEQLLEGVMQGPARSQADPQVHHQSQQQDPTPLPIHVDGPRQASARQRVTVQLRGQHQQGHLTGADHLSAKGCTRMGTEQMCQLSRTPQEILELCGGIEAKFHQEGGKVWIKESTFLKIERK